MARDEMSFRDLKNREIINEVDGRRLGKAKDIVFSPRKGQILGLVAPFHHRVFPVFRGEQVYIPFKNIIKIGPDIILVKLTPDLCRPDGCIDMKGGHHHHGGGGGYHHREEQREEKREEGREERREERRDDRREERRDCDKRCEKCMMFDCERRWEGMK